MRNTFRTVIAATVSATVATASLVAFTSSPTLAASSKSSLTVALITSQTGLAGPEYGDASQGFLARIALQNAQGGINGHKIVPLVIDDQSSPTAVVTGVQEAISKGAIGIVSESPVFFLAAKYPEQAGIPVTGGSFDGPEWGTQPYTNMFAADSGSIDPKYPVNTVFSSFLRAHGGTVIGSYGYGISPTSVRGATYTADGFQMGGGKVGVLATSIPFGSVDFTSESLLAKQKNVNAVFAAMDGDSNIALATALKQAGVKTKAVVFPDRIRARPGVFTGVVNVPGRLLRRRVPPGSRPGCRARNSSPRRCRSTSTDPRASSTTTASPRPGWAPT